MSFSRRFFSGGFALALLAVSAVAAAQTDSTTGGAIPVRVEIEPAIEGAGDEFARLAAQTELYRAQTALLEAQRAAEEARGRLSGGVTAQAAPLLIGIFGAGQVRLAEIALGSTSRRLRVGDYVSDEYRLAAIEQGSVVLVDSRGSRSRLFLNKRAAPEPVGGSGPMPAAPGAYGTAPNAFLNATPSSPQGR